VAFINRKTTTPTDTGAESWDVDQLGAAIATFDAEEQRILALPPIETPKVDEGAVLEAVLKGTRIQDPNVDQERQERERRLARIRESRRKLVVRLCLLKMAEHARALEAPIAELRHELVALADAAAALQAQQLRVQTALRACERIEVLYESERVTFQNHGGDVDYRDVRPAVPTPIKGLSNHFQPLIGDKFAPGPVSVWFTDAREAGIVH
jgi:predicted RNase H-like nuclease (RuvC/YqgF family)